MEFALLYAIGYFVSEAPWYFLATVPFWGRERIKKLYVLFIILAAVFLRILAGYLLVAYVPNGESLNESANMLRPLLLLAIYPLCYKVHITKLLYSILLITTFALPIDFAASLISLPFWMPKLLEGDVAIIVAAEPSWIISVSLLIAVSLPFAYLLLRGLVRRALSELSAKTVFFLCATPALFYTVYVGSVLSSSFSNSTILFVIPFSGLFCAFINLRMIVSTMKDMQTKKDLAAESAALERVNLLKTDMMRTISHEMLTPLAVMMGFAEITVENARKLDVDEGIISNLCTIAAETGRMADIMEEMREFALAREYPKDRHPVDLSSVIHQIGGLYAKVLERHGIRLVINTADNIPAVYGNGNELTQVLFNLLRNAETHTENGEVTIRADVQGELVKVTVSDTGTGITPEILPHVFERGVHGGSGSGFGLAICRDIITAYDGEIWVESDGINGTQATFTLPIYRGAADE